MYEVKALLLGSVNYIYPDNLDLPIIRIYISSTGEVNFAFWNNNGLWEDFYIDNHSLFSKIARSFLFSKPVYMINDMPPIDELTLCLIDEIRLQLK